MALDFKTTHAVAKAMLDRFTVQNDDGAGAAVIRIYDGAVPATAATALSGNTLLAELDFSATSFGAAADDGNNATITAAAIADETNAPASGTATFFRFLANQGSGSVTAQGTAGTSDSDLILNTTSIAAGSTVSVTSATVSLPLSA